MGFQNSISFIILLLTLLFQSPLYLPVVAATREFLFPGDEITSLDSDSYLVSITGVITLGFYTIPSTNLTYLAIWLTYEPHDMIIWVANRDTPVLGMARFRVNSLGVLEVIDTNEGVEFSVFFHLIGNMTAYLDDYGSLSVYDFSNPSGLIQWQSSEHPTDTLVFFIDLPMTNQSRTLTSWLSDQVPASGAFTLTFEEYRDSPRLVIYRRGKIYWASGPWNSTARTFQFLSFVNGSSFIFPQLDPHSSASILLKLSPNGQFKYGPNQLSLTPEFCYGYESDNGCVVSALSNCRGKNDSFQLRSGDWKGGSSIKDDNSNISHADCTERCWNDCTCTGFNTMNSDGTGCILWNIGATFHESDQAAKKYVLLSTSPPPPQKTTPLPPSPPPPPPKKNTWIWIVVSLAIVLLCVSAYVILKRRIVKAKENKRDDFINQMIGSNSFNYGDELERGINGAPDVKNFSLKAIMAATNNFSDENKLGRGGYGPVYKGKLSDGREIAIKRLSKTSGQGIVEFKSELILISKLQHTNLVRLYGCCIHQQEKMLVYEFMPNKSLDFFLFAQDEKKKISWQIRFNIIEGVAQGLLYLHKYSRMKVIHRDLKVGNVLLDANMYPKIADFGMARIFEHNVTEAVTKRVVGTL